MNEDLGVDLSRYERIAEFTEQDVMTIVLVDVYCTDEEISHYSWEELRQIAEERDEEAAQEFINSLEGDYD
jgi:hypothetical protein